MKNSPRTEQRLAWMHTAPSVGMEGELVIMARRTDSMGYNEEPAPICYIPGDIWSDEDSKAEEVVKELTQDILKRHPEAVNKGIYVCTPLRELSFVSESAYISAVSKGFEDAIAKCFGANSDCDIAVSPPQEQDKKGKE